MTLLRCCAIALLAGLTATGEARAEPAAPAAWDVSAILSLRADATAGGALITSAVSNPFGIQAGMAGTIGVNATGKLSAAFEIVSTYGLMRLDLTTRSESILAVAGGEGSYVTLSGEAAPGGAGLVAGAFSFVGQRIGEDTIGVLSLKLPDWSRSGLFGAGAFAFGGASASLAGSAYQATGPSGDPTLGPSPIAVPEPAALLLFAVGVAALAVLPRRRSART
ncbi:PEP-CTERM sorting domain-containing protein [Roseomonas sp. CCTCC AB2023176]|uniref:PEP-CTERM sorting domain-containing protein n=1 Tax=Roseomonas sp. CCTCC AB2023176 TaxID=3342640 RepID=UPI0035E17890